MYRTVRYLRWTRSHVEGGNNGRQHSLIVMYVCMCVCMPFKVLTCTYCRYVGYAEKKKQKKTGRVPSHRKKNRKSNGYGQTDR